MAGRFLRDNAFLVAAVCLPVVVIGLFLVVTAIPKWTVPPPQHDLLLYTTEYDWPGSNVSVELSVRDGKLQARVRPVAKDAHPPRVRLWRFDHHTLRTSEIPIDIPAQIQQGEATLNVPVDGSRILTDQKAPDGYELRSSTHRGAGLVGDLFGMGRYDQSLAIVNRGRVVPVQPMSPDRYQTPAFLGWILNEGAH